MAGKLERGQWIDAVEVQFASREEVRILSSRNLNALPDGEPWTCVDVFVDPNVAVSADNALVRVYGYVNGIKGEVGRGRVLKALGEQKVVSVRGSGASYYEVTIQAGVFANAHVNTGDPGQPAGAVMQASLSCFGHVPLADADPNIVFATSDASSLFLLTNTVAQPVRVYEVSATNPSAIDLWLFVTDSADATATGPVVNPLYVPKQGGIASQSFTKDRPLKLTKGCALRASTTSDVFTAAAGPNGLTMTAGYA